MLPRKHRLTTEKDIMRVLKTGRAVLTNLLILKALKNNLGYMRAAVVVSTKVDKSAVKRNLVKRRIRSVLGKTIHNINTGVDLVILGQKEAVLRPQQAIEEAIKYCFKKIGLGL
jgi:ribonuclease P protein component